MQSSSMFLCTRSEKGGMSVLLVTSDALLILDLQGVFNSLGLGVETVRDIEAAMASMFSLAEPAVIVLDGRLAGVANGRLLAAMQDAGVRKRYAVALIADQLSEEWIARLRGGAIDDIVPRNADALAWRTHLSTMRRGHELYCELELLREASLIEVQHDPVTGTFNRETMLTLLFRETDRVQRLRGSLCLVMFEIDELERWNSELGHDACDGLLREVAARTGLILRSYDLLGRTRENEFLLALPGCSMIDAVLLAERLRMDVFGEPFAVQDSADDKTNEASSVRLTASFGITSSRGRSPVVVLRETERTLALGKRSGPGSIRCASELPLPEESQADMILLFPEAGMRA